MMITRTAADVGKDVLDVRQAADYLHHWRRRSGSITIGSIGPAGTSADDALGALADVAASAHGVPLTPILHPTFERVMADLLYGELEFALVPSAYRDATTFHWHPQIQLGTFFVHRTPQYGLASRVGGVPTSPRRKIVIAAMSEISGLFDQLAPPELLARLTVYSWARSTSDAASCVAVGDADIAVCNEPSRALHRLQWIVSRPGVDIVWMLFHRETMPANAEGRGDADWPLHRPQGR